MNNDSDVTYSGTETCAVFFIALLRGVTAFPLLSNRTLCAGVMDFLGLADILFLALALTVLYGTAHNSLVFLFVGNGGRHHRRRPLFRAGLNVRRYLFVRNIYLHRRSARAGRFRDGETPTALLDTSTRNTMMSHTLYEAG
jgi:hypothetical protein